MLLSRLAQNVYWLGRYLERSEDLTRAIFAMERIRLDMPDAMLNGWGPLLTLCEAPKTTRNDDDEDEFSKLGRVMLDEQAMGSLGHSIRSARENLRSCRAILPRAAWDTLNPAYLSIVDARQSGTWNDLTVALSTVESACQRIVAQLSECMVRDEAYSFVRMGRAIERVDMMLRVTQMTEELEPRSSSARFSNVRWMGLLLSLNAYQMFRRGHRGQVNARTTLEFLITDRRFPRSLWFSLNEASSALTLLPQSDDLVDRCRRLAEHPLPRTIERPRAFATHLLSGVADLSSAIEEVYFHPN